MAYRAPKDFTESRTVRFNLVLGAIAAFLATIPEASVTPPFSTIVAMLPQHWREIVAAVIGVIAALNLFFRLVTRGPVNPPKLPGVTS